MARLGHSSTRAAMIYQHATRDRDQAIAKALGEPGPPRLRTDRATGQRGRAGTHTGTTAVARVWLDPPIRVALTG